jgi:hypothetical protein
VPVTLSLEVGSASMSVRDLLQLNWAPSSSSIASPESP